MISDEKWRENLAKRPLFAVGQRVRIAIEQMPYHDAEAEVISVNAWQTISGYVQTYRYRLRLDNLGEIELMEEDLKP